MAFINETENPENTKTEPLSDRERLERIAEIVRAFYKYQPIVSFVDIGTRKLAEATIVINEIAKLCL